jgi:pSer/pThr/pTyr-binding forkhead associated (FHA) protein
MNDQEQALQLFRSSCGLSVPLELECEDTRRPAADRVLHQLACPFALIGRGSRCDLCLDHDNISRRHALLQTIAGQVFVIDLHSRTKIQWENERAFRSHGWFDGARFIQFGPYRLRRRDGRPVDPEGGEPPDPRAALTPDFEALPGAALELPIRIADRATQWVLESRLALVGRSGENQLVLTDDSVSRFHAVLLRTPLGMWVIDLGTREGCHVNGERVRWAWLGDGDGVRFGRLTFIVRCDTPAHGIDRQDVPLAAGASLAAHPGTDLAVRAGGHVQMPRVRSLGRSPSALNGLIATSDLMSPEPLAPSAGRWEPAIGRSPDVMVLWQQQMQMMELFHNDMIMMFQMFMAMHGEQLASVRDELGRVQQLTRELSELQVRLVDPGGAAKTERKEASDRALPKTRPAPAAIEQQPGGKPGPGAARPAAGKRQGAARDPAGAARASHRESPAAGGTSSPRADQADGGGSAHVHEMLTKRIAELQRERQGYWQRILSVLNN